MESAQKVWKDPQSGHVRIPHLPGRPSEWVRGRHKPATLETLCSDLVIKPQQCRKYKKAEEDSRGRQVHWLSSHNPDVGAQVVLPVSQSKSVPIKHSSKTVSSQIFHWRSEVLKVCRVL